jgi:predicted nucleic acid-binding protein
LPNPDPMLIYLDTNVYSRPFDDQTQPDVQEEANAFLEIVSAVEANELAFLCSDVLAFEVYNILSEEKWTKVVDHLGLCAEHIENSEQVLNLGRDIQRDCQVRARDALHLASAILGEARYFLSCDKKIIRKRPDRCYRRLASAHRQEYFSAMSPTLFVEKMKRGELE